MAFPLAAVAIGAALAKGVGGFFKKRSQNKKEDAAAAEKFRSDKATHESSEARRIAQLKSLLSNAAARGHNLQSDPSLLEARPFTGADMRGVVSAGRGSDLAGDILGGVGGFAGDVVQARQLDDLLRSAGQPTGGTELLSPEELAFIEGEDGDPFETDELVRQLLEERRKDA